jgi:hypothetical protein
MMQVKGKCKGKGKGKMNLNVKFTLEETAKAQRGIRDITLLIL